MELNKVVDIICEVSINPVFVCSSNEFVDCSEDFVYMLGLETKADLNNMVFEEILERYFSPMAFPVKDFWRTSELTELNFAQVLACNKKRFVPLKVKKWSYRDIPYFTIALPEPSKTTMPNSNHFYNQRNTNSVLDMGLNDTSPERGYEELKRFSDSLPCPLYCLDPFGRQLFVNEKYKNDLNLDPNQSWANILRKDEATEIIDKFNKSLKTGDKFEIECLLRPNPLKTNKEPIFRWYSNTAVPLYYPGTDIINKWVGTIIDINDIKIARQKGLEATLEENSRAKNELLAVMSHELRTPLFGVIGSASLLAEKLKDSEHKFLVQTIHTSATFLLTLIQDILDFTRLESGKLFIIRDYFDLSSLLRNVMSITKINADIKGLSFKMDATNVDYELYGDFNRIMQVFNNLLSNAIKFTEEGSISIEVCLKPKGAHESVLIVEIKDTGCGVSSGTLSKLFNPWTQEERGAKVPMSSGLGLYISKSLINMMNGDIGLERMDIGTRAWFNIPFSDVNNVGFTRTNKEKASKKIKTSTSEPSFQKIVKTNKHKILLAEDNLVNQKIMIKFLNNIGLECDLATDGKEALEYYYKHEKGYYRLILMDNSMPKYDGEYVLRKVKTRDISQKIISVSANILFNNKADKDYTRKSLYDDIISKPFTFQEFSAVINKWLDNTREPNVS